MTATAAQGPVLERGDRIPNFVLPNYDGRGMMFYDRACGFPGLILVETEPSSRLNAEVAALATAAPQLSAVDAEINVISQRPAEEGARLADELGGDAAVLSDPAGRISAAFADASFPAAAASPPLFAIVYNENQRVAGVLSANAGPIVPRALDLLESPDEPPVEIVSQAPVLVIPDLLAHDDCAALIDHWRSGHSEGGVSAYRDGKAYEAKVLAQKKRRDRLVDDRALRARVMGRVAKRLTSEMFKAFAYQNFILEPPIVGCYDAARQDYFRRHRDNLSPQTASRRFAMSLNLNDGYDGGTLTFPEYGPQEYRPPAGAGVVFSCAHIHEAKPVTRGERFVLLTFLHDPDRAPHPWSMPSNRNA